MTLQEHPATNQINLEEQTMRKIIMLLLATAFCCLAVDAGAKITINPPPEVTTNLLARDLKALTTDRKPLLEKFNATQVKIDRQAANCSGVEEGSAKAADCIAEARAVKLAVQDYRAALTNFQTHIAGAEYAFKLVNGLNAMARLPEWSSVDPARLDKALNALGWDGDARKTHGQILQTWKTMLTRSNDNVLAGEASHGEGPGFPGAGEQTRYNDCTLFALANASGVPYGVVAARATQLIGDGDWHTAGERANPQRVIEQGGLNGGEVIMMAESLGQAEVVRSADFAKTLKEGRPVLVGVSSQGGAHEVVLTKSFQHGGETWFEMMDSNQGPVKRLYLSNKELNSILQENGVAYRPEPGNTPKLLR